MENIVSTDNSVKRQITDSISENLADSDLENIYFNNVFLITIYIVIEKLLNLFILFILFPWNYSI